jgi:hypothetical protein
MKVSRIALGLLIPLSGMTVLAVYLNAQPPAAELPLLVPRTPNPTVVRELPGSQYRIEKYYGNLSQDPKTLQLLNDEQAADQEARSFAVQYAQAQTDEQRAEVKKQLKEKLVAIFEMQQKRRTAEIASIEERLAKLKDVSKKRETNKDAIVDRRLEQLTGGVDELGWEESGRYAVPPPIGPPGGLYVEPDPNSNNFRLPTTTPRFDVPAAEPAVRTTAPPAK